MLKKVVSERAAELLVDEMPNLQDGKKPRIREESEDSK